MFLCVQRQYPVNIAFEPLLWSGEVFNVAIQNLFDINIRSLMTGPNGERYTSTDVPSIKNEFIGIFEEFSYTNGGLLIIAGYSTTEP